MFGLEFRLYIDALLEENALQQGVLVSQHEALVCCCAMGRIEIVQGLFLDTNCLFQLLDVLCAPFSECGLRLSVPLLPLLCGCVDLLCVLAIGSDDRDVALFDEIIETRATYRLAASFALGSLLGRRIRRA